MINVTLGEVKTQNEKPFPKLMKHKKNGRINLFYNRTCATVIINRQDEVPVILGVGEHSTNLNANEYEDYNAPITLQNA